MSGEIDIVIYPLALTTAIPLLLGVLCYLLPNKHIRNLIVGIGTLSAIIGSLWLFLHLTTVEGEISLAIDRISLLGKSFSLFELIAALDFALLAGFLLIAVERKSFWAGLFAVLQLIPLGWYEIYYMPLHETDHLNPIRIDYWSGIMCLIISIIGSLIAIYAVKYMEGQKNQNRFFAYVIGFLGAMNAAVFSDNLLWFFFFWEVTTLACYMLIKHEETEEALRNAKWALEVTLGGGTAMAFGIVILGTMSPAITTFSEIVAKASETAGAIPGLLILSLAFVSLAGLTKSAQVPFQSWLLGAMVAPTPVSALLHSSTMVKLGVYLFIRLSPVFNHIQSLGYLIAIIGGFSFMVTAILAISQNNAKKVLAYSTIGNLGLIIMLASLHSPFALAAAIVLTVFHAISKALLFLGVGVVQHETHSKEIEKMDGLIVRKPFITTVLLMGILTMIIPPFGMFLGKYFAVQASLEMPIIVFFLAVGSAATVVYYLKWIGRMINMETEEELTPERMSVLFSAPLVIMLSLAVILSVMISPIVESFINPTVQVLLGVTSPLHAVTYATTLATTWGYFSPVFVAIFLAIVLLVPALSKVEKKDLTKVYSCGIEYPTVLGGAYFEKHIGEEKMNLYVNSLGIGLMITLLALGALAITITGVW
ncbi:MAG: proton-conducting transporter membrane subunit [Thermoplasmata archaeon]|nr:proton-conducting transporter membrane subunit [Thermoplasmata archaeon]